MTEPGRNESMDREKVLGGLEVEALLRHGSEHLFLLFTQNRLILAHYAKTGGGSVPLYSILGKMSEGLTRAASKKGTLQKMVGMDPEGILQLHKDNFAIEYPQVVTMIVEPGVRDRSKITLITNDQKMELYASQAAAEGVRESVQSLLSGKAEYRTRFG